MGLIDLFWNISQSSRIAAAEELTKATAERSREGVTRATLVAEDLERLSLLTRAMWELLSNKLGVSEDELFAKVREVDLRDGVADGKLRRSPVECAQCKRTNNSRRDKCLYCGAEFPRGSAFDAAP